MHFWPYGATILAGILGILFLAVLAYCCLKEIRRQSEDDDLSKAENGTASSVRANNARRRSNDRTGNFREQSSAKNRQPKATGAQRPTPSVSYQRRIVPTISTEDEKRKQHYGLRKKGTLDVYQVINENQKIPPTTKNRHLYCEPGGLDKSKALKISQERGTDFATSISPVNTVFRNSKGYLLCKTNDAKYPSLVMSKEKVETFQCRYNKSTETWSASFEGHFHSIFTINATHFPGYVYRNVNFHNDTRKYLN